MEGAGKFPEDESWGVYRAIQERRDVRSGFLPEPLGDEVLGRLLEAVCAVQNLWLAARAEGIGVGWVSVLDNEPCKKVLDIPENIVPVAYLCLGDVDHSAEPDLERAGWEHRIPLDHVLGFEQYNSRWSAEEKTP